MLKLRFLSGGLTMALENDFYRDINIRETINKLYISTLQLQPGSRA